MDWIYNNALALPEDQCERKKLKTETEVARRALYTEVTLTKDRQRESENGGGEELNRASFSIAYQKL